MADIRGPDYELAEKDYMNGMKYKDIASKYRVSINTVKSWKTRYKWNRNSVHTNEKKSKKVCTQNNTISWVEIENEYVTDIRRKPYTLENLSTKYNIPIQTIKDYSATNEWSKKRTEYKLITNQKTKEKTAELISSEIAKYKAKHLNISDKLLGYLDEALSNKTELYKHVAKLRTGYGPGEFNEKITSETLDNINDSKLLNMVNALSKLQKIQRQTLGILDEKDKLQYGLNREKLDFEKAQKSNNQDDKPIEILIKRKGED
ncbi:phage terminase small subunit-related protein [Clostridium tetani]|uniref:phage terminase small subunit-related protein n=1 Tax=Clostridium tetani TaxID=1513 RepID=UPI0038B3BB36